MKIKYLSFFYLGKPKTKSIEISTQGSVGTDNGVYNPCKINFVGIIIDPL
jgi:hypothetical protein